MPEDLKPHIPKLKKIYPDFNHERELVARGFSYICGVDEVGRGAWAGPVVAAAVVFPKILITSDNLPTYIKEIRDSKVLSKKKREELDAIIKDESIWAIGEASPKEIDIIGIGPATRLAMVRAIQEREGTPDYAIVDGREQLQLHIPQHSIVDGDALSISIAAASIIAKVHRDHFMEELHAKHPEYALAEHVGYGTKKHIEALEKHGPIEIHRKSYAPIKKFLLAHGAK